LHCQAYGDLIPIAFVLGFYVSVVIKRWWDQYICMPWPDNLAMFVSTLVHGQVGYNEVFDIGRMTENVCCLIGYELIDG